MRLGGVRGWCPRASPKAGASRGRGPGGEGGPQAGRKVGGDYPPHMDTTPKGPPIPPTPDILSSLSRRGISDLSIVVVPLRQVLRRHQRCRISSRRPPSLLLRTSSSFTSSPTCLDPLRPLCPVIEKPPIRRRFFSVLENKCRARRSFIAAGSETILFEDNATTLGTGHRTDGKFCTYHVFIPRRRVFDAYFIKADQRRAGRSHRLTTAVIFCVGEHIDRLRPQKRLTRKYSLKLREQCRAALPHGLCKVSDFYLLTCDTCRILMRQSATRLSALPYDNTCQHQ